jgi:hypothetical protein
LGCGQDTGEFILASSPKTRHEQKSVPPPSCVEDDARFTLYFIPQRFRQKEGVVNYGFCQFNFPDIVPVGKD